MKAQIIFVVETGAVGRNEAEIKDAAIRIGTRIWLDVKDGKALRDLGAQLVSVTAKGTDP